MQPIPATYAEYAVKGRRIEPIRLVFTPVLPASLAPMVEGRPRAAMARPDAQEFSASHALCANIPRIVKKQRSVALLWVLLRQCQ